MSLFDNVFEIKSLTRLIESDNIELISSQLLRAQIKHFDAVITTTKTCDKL